jgi:hypothetical protein
MAKKGVTTQVFSIFGQIERVAAELMIKDGQAVRIPREQIPAEVATNVRGDRASFAVLMQTKHVSKFENLIKDLRA